MSDRRARRHEATRQEILDAAWALAREHGLTGWSLREVAAAVDMRAPSLYGYFASKDAIYDAMFAQGYQELLDRAALLPSSSEDPVEVLHRAAELFFTFCTEDPARYQLLFLRVVPGFTPSAPSYALAERTLEELGTALERAGLTDDRSLDLWTAVLTGLASQQISNDPDGDRWARLIDDAVDRFLVRRVAPTTEN